MANNILVKTLLKSVMPTVQKFVESGKIDALLKELKSRLADRLCTEKSKMCKKHTQYGMFS